MAYSKKTWVDDELITKNAMNNIESGIAANDSKNTTQDADIASLKKKAVNATSNTPGFVKQASKIDAIGAADATTASSTPTKAEVDKLVTLSNETKSQVNALIAALKSAGIMVSA